MANRLNNLGRTTLRTVGPSLGLALSLSRPMSDLTLGTLPTPWAKVTPWSIRPSVSVFIPPGLEVVAGFGPQPHGVVKDC